MLAATIAAIVFRIFGGTAPIATLAAVVAGSSTVAAGSGFVAAGWGFVVFESSRAGTRTLCGHFSIYFAE